MEYYLTTYTKDYKWPVLHSPSKAKKDVEHSNKLIEEQVKPDPCSLYKSLALEEPPTDPAQCGAPPAGPESKYGQPLTYLRKLYLKYPYLYQILKLTPPEELAKTIYGNKYISTYTSDYKVEGFSPLNGYFIPKIMNKTEHANEDGLDGPGQPENILGSVHGECEHAMQPLGKQGAKFVGGTHPPKLGKWKTEYRDTISKVGGVIIQKKLLSRVPVELLNATNK